MTCRLLFILSLSLIAGCAGGFVIGCGPDSDPAQGSTPASSVAGTSPRIVEVAANRGWQDSGIGVAPNQKFQLRYRSGEIIDKDTKIADAHGSDYVWTSLPSATAANSVRRHAVRFSCESMTATMAWPTILGD